MEGTERKLNQALRCLWVSGEVPKDKGNGRKANKTLET